MPCVRVNKKTALFIRIPGVGGAVVERLLGALADSAENGEVWGTGPVWGASELEAAYRPWMFNGALAVVRDPVERALSYWHGPLSGHEAEWLLNDWVERQLYASSIYPNWEDRRWEDQVDFLPVGADWEKKTKIFDRSRREEAALWLQSVTKAELDTPFPFPFSASSGSRLCDIKVRRLLSPDSEQSLRARYSRDYEAFSDRFGWL